jgi:hypothetical protein
MHEVSSRGNTHVDYDTFQDACCEVDVIESHKKARLHTSCTNCTSSRPRDAGLQVCMPDCLSECGPTCAEEPAPEERAAAGW